MRIITGTARGMRLETLEGTATRPTAEKVKEALFSMIQFDIEGRRVLDLFGGSGQLALEALSRGAASATIIDASRDAASLIIRNAQKTKLYDRTRILTCDWEAYLRGNAGKERFDIVFIDPPYASDYAHRAVDMLISGDMLTGGALIAVESGSAEPTEHDGLRILRHTRYAKTYITLYIYGDGQSEFVTQ